MIGFYRFKMILFVLLALSGCTNYTREINLTVEDGGYLKIGDVEVVANVKKGDENMKNNPDITPDINIPLSGLLP